MYKHFPNDDRPWPACISKGHKCNFVKQHLTCKFRTYRPTRRWKLGNIKTLESSFNWARAPGKHAKYQNPWIRRLRIRIGGLFCLRKFPSFFLLSSTNLFQIVFLIEIYLLIWFNSLFSLEEETTFFFFSNKVFLFCDFYLEVAGDCSKFEVNHGVLQERNCAFSPPFSRCEYFVLLILTFFFQLYFAISDYWIYVSGATV